jgi:hypothetical protein
MMQNMYVKIILILNIFENKNFNSIELKFSYKQGTYMPYEGN